MRLSIATNWQSGLIDGLASYPVKELFGSLPHTPVGSGRPTMFLPDVSRAEAEGHIRAARQAGIEFNYLLNGICLGAVRKQPLEKALAEHLEWLAGLGVATVTAAHPFVLEIIKARFPDLRVKMSVLADFDTVIKVQRLEALGADEVALSIMQNRNFDFLEAVIGATRCELTLLVNQACLYMCPHRLHHGAVNAHASNDSSRDEGFGVNYCLVKCSKEKLSHPGALIRSRWIRPEDLSVYESIGYETFKIAGREMSTEWILNTVRAYSRRSYRGNLSDILNGIAVMMGSKGNGACRLPRIDNQKLTVFLDQFEKRRCLGHCVSCRYCDRVAQEAVELFEKENAGYMKTLSMIEETIL